MRFSLAIIMWCPTSVSSFPKQEILGSNPGGPATFINPAISSSDYSKRVGIEKGFLASITVLPEKGAREGITIDEKSLP